MRIVTESARHLLRKDIHVPKQMSFLERDSSMNAGQRGKEESEVSEKTGDTNVVTFQFMRKKDFNDYLKQKQNNEYTAEILQRGGVLVSNRNNISFKRDAACHKRKKLKSLTRINGISRQTEEKRDSSMDRAVQVKFSGVLQTEEVQGSKLNLMRMGKASDKGSSISTLSKSRRDYIVDHEPRDDQLKKNMVLRGVEALKHSAGIKEVEEKPSKDFSFFSRIRPVNKRVKLSSIEPLENIEEYPSEKKPSSKALDIKGRPALPNRRPRGLIPVTTGIIPIKEAMMEEASLRRTFKGAAKNSENEDRNSPSLPANIGEGVQKKQVQAVSGKTNLKNQKDELTAKFRQALLRIFFGVSGESKKGLATRIFVGEGNNQSLVIRTIAQRSSLVIDGFYTRSNFLWTQTAFKKFSPILAENFDTYSFLKYGLIKDLDFTEYKQKVTWDNLAKVFAKQNLFSVDKEIDLSILFERMKNKGQVVVYNQDQLLLNNHLKGLMHISRKTLLAETLVKYFKGLSLNVLAVIPKTYLIYGDTFDQDLKAVMKEAETTEDGTLKVPLIIKPGEFSNRGKGIEMAYTLADIKSMAENVIESRKRTSNVIVQSYIANPLLYKGRKFDIRCYALVVKLFDRLSFFWYKDGYARTSSYEYDLNARDNLKVHLTNEAVQVKGSLFSLQTSPLSASTSQETRSTTSTLTSTSGIIPPSRSREKLVNKSL